MNYFDPNNLEGLFDHVILNAFSNGPLSPLEVQARVQTVRIYLDLIAARKAVRSLPDSLVVRLEQLRRDGWLESHSRQTKDSGVEIIYSLTLSGRERVQQELKRRDAIVAQFIDEANLDGSFRRFLHRTGRLGSDE